MLKRYRKKLLLVCVLLGLCQISFAESFSAEDLYREKQASTNYMMNIWQTTPKDRLLELPRDVLVEVIHDAPDSTRPSADSYVTVILDTIDRKGNILTSSWNEEQKVATYKFDLLIDCLQIALKEMAVGSVFQITCPSKTDLKKWQRELIGINPETVLTYTVVFLGVDRTR